MIAENGNGNRGSARRIVVATLAPNTMDTGVAVNYQATATDS
jgi:hypothetical protein